MCGIAGILSTAGLLPGDGDLLRRMTLVMAHRGPDDAGCYADSTVALGHRRLAIIDLSKNGHQPMSNEDGTVWIVFNGEIYNFKDLKAKYRLDENHAFRSNTDTEVILHLYEELGPAMVSELNGMFAFAIWDANTRELHLTRDRHGIKPLFYTQNDGRVVFGSEIKCILQDPSVKRRVDLQAMHDFLTFDYVPGGQTAFAGISELPPSHWMTVSESGAVATRRYWHVSFSVDRSITEKDAVERCRELLDGAVHRQLVADVPIGVLLSGGMDSSTILAMMSRHTSESIHTYSVGFEDGSFNELPYARRAANHFGAIQHEVIVTADVVRSLLPKYLSYIDEPYADGSAIPTYCVCEIAKDNVVVVLSGEGGDEAFAGYDTHAAFKASRWFRRVPRWVRDGLIAPFVHSLPVSHKKLSLEFKLKRFLGGQNLPPDEAHLWWRIVLTEAQKRDLYTPAVLDAFAAQESVRHFTEVFGRSTAADTLNRLLQIDSTVFLPDDLMIKNDRMSMAHSLEARVPLTDHELVDYLGTVPPNLKLPWLRKKHLMRGAMRGILPDAILNKKKVGLEMPYSRWLKHELRDLLMTYCGPARVSATGLFRPAAVQALINQHMRGDADHGRVLWGLLNFMMWVDIYSPEPF